MSSDPLRYLFAPLGDPFLGLTRPFTILAILVPKVIAHPQAWESGVLSETQLSKWNITVELLRNNWTEIGNL